MRQRSWQFMISMALMLILVPNQAWASSLDGSTILSSSWFLWMLVSIGLLGLMLELMIPGHFVSGLISVIAFMSYFWLLVDKNEPNWMIVLAFIFGFIFLFIEVLIPGFGIFGILGITGIFSAIIMASPTVVEGIFALLLGLIFTILVLWILYRFFGLRAKWGKITLTSVLDKKTGFNSSSDRSYLIGKRGVAVTPLRPSGWAQFEHSREDVVSDGELIASGTPVEVIYVEGSRVVVSRVKEDGEPKTDET